MTEHEKQLIKENKELKIRLSEAEDALNAIRNGEVDAIVVSGDASEKIFSLTTAETPYRIIIEQMEEGAITLNETGIILYSNQRFSEMTGIPLSQITGKQLSSFVEQAEFEKLDALLKRGLEGRSTDEFRLLSSSADFEYCQFTVNALPDDMEGHFFLIVTNITFNKKYEENLMSIVKEKTIELEETNQKLKEDIEIRIRIENEQAFLTTEIEKRAAELDSTFLSMATGVMVYDLTGKAVRINNKAKEIFDPELLFTTTLQERYEIGGWITETGQLFSMEDVPVKLALRGETINNRVMGIPLNNGKAWISVNAAPIRTSKGEMIGAVVTFIDITDRKIIEENLRRTEEQFQLALKNAPVTVAIQDVNLVFTWAYNQKSRKNEDIIGKTDADLFTPEDIEWITPLKESILKDGRESYVEKWVTSNDRRLFLGINYQPMKNSAGKITGIGISTIDLTGIKQAEIGLEISLSKYKTLFDTLPIGITVSDDKGNILESNKISEILLGLTQEEQAQRKINGREWQLIRPDGTPMSSDEFASVRSLKEQRLIENVEMGVVKANGSINWISVNAIPIGLEGYGVLITYSDITHRKHAEETIRKSESMLRGILQATKESIWMFSPAGKILLANSTAINRLGMNEKDVIGRQFVEVTPKDIGHSRMEKLRTVVKTAQPLDFEDIRSGINFLHSFYPIIDTTGKVTSVVSFSRDITERKLVEAKIQSILNRFYLILSNLHYGILLVRDNDTVEFANQTFCDFFKLKESPEELSGLTAYKILELIKSAYSAPDKELNRIRDIVSLGVVVNGEEISMNGDHSYIRDFIPIKVDGRLYGRLWTHIDITELKKYEENLKRLIRTLGAMQKSSLLMIHATDEKNFLEQVCNIIIEDCGHTMVWIGYKQMDEEKSVKPVAFAGFEENYLDTLKISWADTQRGRGPTGTAIRTGKMALCKNMLTDPDFDPWREEALKRGYSSSISLPLFMDEETFGAMMIYSKDPDPFSENEQELLTKLAHDLAYGIKAIRLNLELKQAREDLEEKVEHRTALLQKTLVDLDAEKQKFQDLLNQIPAYVALITMDQEIVYTNKHFTEYFGELNNQKCYEVFFGRSQVCDNCKAVKVFDSSQAFHWEAVCQNDRIYQISDFIYENDQDQPLILEIGVDITDKRNMEKLIISKILETEERDRRRFASDLHDDLGPTLSAIKLQLSLLAKVNSAKQKNELLTLCDQLLLEGIDKMRTVANNILPNLIESYGLETGVKSFITKMELASKIKFHFTSNLKGLRLSQDSELHLYRIVTELVNNTIKHARATEVSLDMKLSDHELRMRYFDNGKGYTVNNDTLNTQGIGIENMRNRINLLHGTIEFIQKDGKTVVFVSKPLSRRLPLNPLV